MLPHGGLFPEEVIVPWLELQSRVEEPSYTFNVSGVGIAGTSGELIVEVTNHGHLALVLQYLVLENGAVVDFPQSSVTRIGALEKRKLSVQCPVWPANSPFRVRIHSRLPNGQQQEHEVMALVQTRAMYRQNDPFAELE
jgi:hypothetical protein